MGLVKQMTMDNGVPLSYHRVVSVNVITNNQNIIEVASYVSQEKRLEEKEMLAALASGDNEASCNVYIDSQYYVAPYDQDMTVCSAYAWLKENAGFEDADDVFEEDEVIGGGEAG